MSAVDPLTETVVFIVHALKRLSYGFRRLDEVADSAKDGSPKKAFYLDGVYGYVAAFFLLDKKAKTPGGAFYRALEPFGLTHLLDPVRAVLDAKFGGETFGKTILAFRNKALVHPRYRHSDVDKVYAHLNMLDPSVRADFQERLERLHETCLTLALELAKAACWHRTSGARDAAVSARWPTRRCT